jgi:hypothetical protein
MMGEVSDRGLGVGHDVSKQVEPRAQLGQMAPQHDYLATQAAETTPVADGQSLAGGVAGFQQLLA